MKKCLVIIVLLAISLFFAFTIYFLKSATKTRHLPVLGQVEQFTLNDAQGKEFGLENLKGKVWVICFFFTTCSDVCPIMTKHMAALHRSFAILDDVAFVSVTVNPEYDSPETLAQFAKKYNADTQRWHFLTGSREAITALMIKNFKIGSIEEPIFHSTKFVLLDRYAQIRSYYDGTSQKGIEQLFKDIAMVVRQR